MKEIINIIIGKEDISVLDKYSAENKEVFERYKNIVAILVNYGKKMYQKGISIENLIEVIKYFFEEYKENVVLSGYYLNGIGEDKIDEEIKRILERQLNIRNISISLEEIDIDSSFSNVTGVEQAKVMSLSNGHPTGTETGFIAPILLAILTATIEITCLLNIFLMAME